MPVVGALLLLAERVVRGGAVDFVEELGADGGDFLVRIALLADGVVAVEHRVDVQARGGRAAGEGAQALDELFLEGVREVVLGAEPDDAAGGD